jgi:hypothetical protein
MGLGIVGGCLRELWEAQNLEALSFGSWVRPHRSFYERVEYGVSKSRKLGTLLAS